MTPLEEMDHLIAPYADLILDTKEGFVVLPAYVYDSLQVLAYKAGCPRGVDASLGFQTATGFVQFLKCEV